MTKTKHDDGLGEAGKALRDELAEIYDFSDSAPLLVELCRAADRLAEIRARIGTEGLTVTQGHGATERTTANPLLAAEAREQAAFARFWKLAGLSDQPPSGPGRTGRPAGRR